MTTVDVRPDRDHIWHCDPNALTCPMGHLKREKDSGFRSSVEIAAHGFHECMKCDPHSFFFAHYTNRPSPIVTCYLISEESYREWFPRAGDTPPTQEMLYHLRAPDGKRYNPTYQPPVVIR